MIHSLVLVGQACGNSSDSTSAQGGAAGTGPGSYKSFAGCTFESAVSASSVAVGQANNYQPACVRVAVGNSLTIGASAMHPMQGMVHNGDSPNPISAGEPSSGFLQDVFVTFPSRGSYGFYCNVHGSDTSKGGQMTGVVYVE